jgi:hypothetical protein
VLCRAPYLPIDNEGSSQSHPTTAYHVGVVGLDVEGLWLKAVFYALGPCRKPAQARRAPGAAFAVVCHFFTHAGVETGFRA